MNDLLSQFVASAKSIVLSREEKAHVRQTLEVMIHKEGFVLSAACATVLTSKEKEVSRSVLQEFMRDHPATLLPHFVGLSVTQEWLSSHFLHRFLSLRFVSGVMAALVIFFSVGGAVAYAAEDSLPGDTLYPLKVYITEPLREHLSLTPHARAAWRAERIMRRLHEVEELVVRSPNQEGVSFFEERVTRHMEKMEERLAAVSSEDDADAIRAQLEVAVKHHESVLSRLEESEVSKERLSELHERAKQKKEYLRRMLREHVRKPLKNKMNMEGEAGVRVRLEESGAHENDDLLQEEKKEEESSEEQEEYLPRLPGILPKVLRRMQQERKPTRSGKDGIRAGSVENSFRRRVEHPLPFEEEEEGKDVSILQKLESEILPSTSLKRFRIEE